MAAARAEVGARETVCRGDPANPRQRRGVAAHGRGSRSARRGNFRKTSAGSQDISDPRGEAGVHAWTTRTEASMQTRIPDLPRTARTTRNWRFGSAELPDPDATGLEMDRASIALHDAVHAARSAATPCVYVVDDDISVRESLESLIASAGLRTLAFAGPADF